MTRGRRDRRLVFGEISVLGCCFFSARDDLGPDTNKNSSVGILLWVVKYGRQLPGEIIRLSFLEIFKEKVAICVRGNSSDAVFQEVRHLVELIARGSFLVFLNGFRYAVKSL